MPRGTALKTLALMESCRAILEEIQPASVRAVCYQLFTRGMIASMEKGETNKVSRALTMARERGVIPWEWVVDETREAERVQAWKNPKAFVRPVKHAYRRDYWVEQPTLVEVWSEKGTVRGTLAPVLSEYGVTFRVMHGYTSSTIVHEVAVESRRDARDWIALYVGDFDPSGLHMSEVDLPARIEEYGGDVLMVRLAIMPEDFENGALKTFDARTKQKDPRYRWFVENNGYICCELDAMSPVTLRAMVEREISMTIDRDAWDRLVAVEQVEMDSMQSILDRWTGNRG